MVQIVQDIAQIVGFTTTLCVTLVRSIGLILRTILHIYMEIAIFICVTMVFMM